MITQSKSQEHSRDQLSEFVPPDLWRAVQEDLAQVTGLSIRIFDADGADLVPPSGVPRFVQLIEDSELGGELTREYLLDLARQCDGVSGCVVATAPTGMMSFAAPVTIGDTRVGTVVGGASVTEPFPADVVRQMAEDFSLDPDELLRAAAELKVRPPAVIESMGELTASFLQHVVKTRRQGRALAQQFEQLRALYDVSHALFASVDMNDRLDSIVDAAATVLKVNVAFVLLLNSESGELLVEAARGFSEETIQTSRFQVGRGIIGHVAATREPAIVPDMHEDPRSDYPWLDERENLRSMMCVPLVQRSDDGDESMIGVLGACDSVPRSFRDEHLELLTALGRQAVIAIQNGRLYRQLQRRNEDLRRAYAELHETQERLIHSERLAAIGQAASGIAHEVRNPLTAIIGSAAMLRDKLDRLNQDQRRELADAIVREGWRLQSVIEEVRNYGKPQTYDKQAQSMADIVREVLVFLRFDESFRRLNVVTEFDGEPVVHVDEQRMKQVLINLLKNAAEALEGKPEGSITVRVTQDEDRVGVSVADNGAGIPSDVLEHIFEPFFTTKGSEGTGLGLDICQRIVREHGGDILVESTQGEGATFTIALPVEGSDLRDD